MKMKIVVLTALLIACVAVVPAIGGQVMAFKQSQECRISAGSGIWANCGYVTLNAPSAGYVVMTASGMAYFNSLSGDPTLTLTLAKTKAVKGPWVFTLTPGVDGYQTYTVRLVFKVGSGKNNFFLNVQSNDGNGQTVGVQTGSLTAEWYPTADVQASGSTSVQADQQGSSAENPNPRRN